MDYLRLVQCLPRLAKGLSWLIRDPVESTQRPLKLSDTFQNLFEAFQDQNEASRGLSQASEGLSGGGGRKESGILMELLPILQDFVPHRGHCPKSVLAI